MGLFSCSHEIHGFEMQDIVVTDDADGFNWPFSGPQVGVTYKGHCWKCKAFVRLTDILDSRALYEFFKQRRQKREATEKASDVTEGEK